MTWSFFREQKNKKSNSRRRAKAAGRRRPRFEPLETRNMLAVLTVNSALDTTIAGDGLVTLREAIVAANTDATTDLGHTGSGADTIQFDPTLNGATITLAGAAELTVDQSLSINPTNLAQLTINAGAASRIFNISDLAGNVSLRGLTLHDGDAGAGNNGGAIFSLSLGTLSIADSRITSSTAANGGGVFAVGDVIVTSSTIGGPGAGEGNSADGSGGGIYSEAKVTLRNSTIAGNTAVNDGGGVFADTMTVDNSTIGGLNAGDANDADGSGGGLSTGTLTMNNSTVAGNIAGVAGGGISVVTALIQRSTISGNTAETSDGGGIDGFNLMLRNSTVAGNHALLDDGGGVYGARVTLQNSTVTGNDAADDGGGVFAVERVTIHNSIIVGNTSSGSFDLRVPATRTVRFSLIGDNDGLPGDPQFDVTGTAAPNGSGNFVGDGAAMAILVADAFGAGGGALANNGGPTQTVELKAGSIAIDRGSNALAVGVSEGDQRGEPFSRISPFGGSVDMGAFETQTPTAGNTAPVVANPIADQSVIVGNFFSLTFPANTFTDADGDPLTYSATLSGGGALPGWLTFDPVSRTFSGTPGPADVAVSTIRLTANDGKGGSIFDEFLLTVTSNPPPVVSNAIPDQTAVVSVPFSFTFAENTFTDPNGDPLTYTATKSDGTPLPAWLSFNAGTRTFSGTPGAGDVGMTTVRVFANDGQGNVVHDDFVVNVVNSELPFNTDFEGPLDARIQQKTAQIELTMASPVNGAQSLRASRLTVGARPLATVDFVNPATAGMVTNVKVNVSTETGNGSSLWSNALVTFDYQSPQNYKFAGVFEIIDRLIIGQVVNGQVTYLAQKQFAAAPNTSIPLDVTINRMTRQVTLTSGATTVQHTFAALGNGTVGVGTINANAKFDNLMIT